MVNRDYLEWQLPHGLSDLFFSVAEQRTRLEAALAETFGRYGYTRIIPPTFEFYESIAAEAGTQLREELYRFFDREGRTLALRADFTIPIARVVATKLYDYPMPLRFFYSGSVFRHEEPRAGRRHEFTQAGIELIGARTAAADAEVIAIAIEALRAMGLQGFRFSIGQAAFFKALVGDLPLSVDTIDALKDAVERRSQARLAPLLPALPVAEDRKRVLAALPHWRHGETWLADARALCLNPAMHAAVDELETLSERLDGMGHAGVYSVNLAELRGMEYYTGVIFQGFVPGIGYPVVSGGRYDELIGHFGRDLPAIGFAIEVERAMMSLAPSAAEVSDAVAEGCGHPACNRRIDELRCSGSRVTVDVLGRSGNDLHEYARSLGAGKVLECLRRA
jgi:ATP phosphoribosyltransferase regulatory subunit